MKKIIALVLAISLVFLIIGCGEKDTSSSNSDLSVSSSTNTTAFVKPENYASVLLVTINPQFKLYLDKDSNVLAVEAVNKDAESLKDSISYKNQKLDTVIKNIVISANDKGFVKENANINFEIVEKKDKEINTADILTNATTAANSAATELEITVTIDKLDIDTNNNSENTDPQDSTSSKDESDNISSEPTKPVHTHSFTNATCTKPKTCSCGATEGNALGHNFREGKCTVCGTADPNYTVTPLSNKNGYWEGIYISNGTYYSVGLNVIGDLSIGVGVGDPLSKMEQEIQDDIRNHKDEPDYKESYIVYQGIEYWCARGSNAPLATIVESGNTITLTALDESTAQIVLTRTDENTLTVKSCTQTFKDMLEDIPVGTKLTFTAN